MSTNARYAVFETEWGYVGLLGAGIGVRRLVLPQAGAHAVERTLLEFDDEAIDDGGYLPLVQEQVKRYFGGVQTDFRDVKVDTGGLSEFSKKVLLACREIPFGLTMSYSQLGECAGFSNAGRAVGSVMAKNRIPLIIPCHRVICSDGRVGEFSAGTGASLKQRLLELEARHVVCRQVKSRAATAR